MTQKDYYFYPTFGFVSIFNGYIPYKMHLKNVAGLPNFLWQPNKRTARLSKCKVLVYSLPRSPSDGWQLSHTFENFVQIFHDFFHYLVERRPCNLTLRCPARKPPSVTACVCNVYAGWCCVVTVRCLSAVPGLVPGGRRARGPRGVRVATAAPLEGKCTLYKCYTLGDMLTWWWVIQMRRIPGFPCRSWQRARNW